MTQRFRNSRSSGRTWCLCEGPTVVLCPTMKLIEFSTNDILSYRKEEVSFSGKDWYTAD